MRVLVIGSYPPPAGGEGHRTIATVHRLSAQGDTVDVLSAVGSAAQLRGAISGPLGAFHAWKHGRKYDAIVVQIESAAPLRMAQGRRARVDRVADCFAWGFALRRLRQVTLVVPDTDAVHRSVGGRTGRFLWTAADRIVVTSEHDRRRLIDEGGAAEARVELVPKAASSDRPSDDGWDGITDAKDVMERVQRRAAEDRRAARRGTLDAGA